MAIAIGVILALGLTLTIFGYLEAVRLLPGGNHVAQVVSAYMVLIGLLLLAIDALLIVGWGIWLFLLA